jgi:hypothetical protein
MSFPCDPHPHLYKSGMHTPSIPSKQSGFIRVGMLLLGLMFASLACSSTASDAPYPTSWKVIFSDSFADNANQWPTKKSTSDLGSLDFHVVDGTYVVTATCGNTDGALYRIFPTTAFRIFNFNIDVDMGQLSGPETVSYGILFRKSNTGYYAFIIQPQKKQYSLMILNAGKWITLIPWTSASTIRTTEFNHLAVLAQGSHIRLSINGDNIHEITDTTFSEGDIGLAIILDAAHDAASVAIDNFEVASP